MNKQKLTIICAISYILSAFTIIISASIIMLIAGVAGLLISAFLHLLLYREENKC